MGKEYAAKSFKSGNSVAIRMPAALGVRPDLEWTVVKHDGEFIIRECAAPKRKFNIAKVAGCAKSLKYVEPESRLFEPRPSAVDAFKSNT